MRWTLTILCSLSMLLSGSFSAGGWVGGSQFELSACCLSSHQSDISSLAADHSACSSSCCQPVQVTQNCCVSTHKTLSETSGNSDETPVDLASECPCSSNGCCCTASAPVLAVLSELGCHLFVGMAQPVEIFDAHLATRSDSPTPPPPKA